MRFPSKEKFRQWLSTLDPNLIVARDWICTNCPLAKWLRHETGVINSIVPSVRDRSEWLNDNNWDEVIRLPKWANTFAIIADNSPQRETHGLTAADCLELLKKRNI